MNNVKILISLTLSVVLLVVISCKKEDKPDISTITFEEIDLEPHGYLNGSAGEGGFTSGNAFFRNRYGFDTLNNSEYWIGFAVSNHTDVLTQGVENQYSSIAGGGEKSANYIVLHSLDQDTIKFITPQKIKNISFSNSTYAYWSMRKGSSSAKKFGGDSGNDPDYFCLVFKVIDHKGTEFTFSDSLFMADFRFTDNSDDYIINTWVNADFSAVGFIRYFIIGFDSSDKDGGVINTPTYICIDNIEGEILK